MEAVNNSISSNCSESYLLDLPESCPFYKLLLVEELVLEEQFEQLHVGKCCVIGKLFQNSEGYFELENLRLPDLPSAYAPREGSFTLRLLDFDVFPDSEALKTGRYCEACGEVVLLNIDTVEGNGNKLLTTYELHLKLRQLPTLEAQIEYLEEIQATHIVALKLHFSKEVERAIELIERNLSLRRYIPQLW